MTKRRAAIAALSAAVLLALEGATLDRRDVTARIGMALGPHDPERDRFAGTDFLFDREYGTFLARVARAAPPGAPVRLCMPRTNELYDYTAAYVLAPRPVRRALPADFAYRCPEAAAP